jgi:hypothetical protein
MLWASDAVSKGYIECTMSMGDQIHVLTYDSQSNTIDVKLITAMPDEPSLGSVIVVFSMDHDGASKSVAVSAV